MATDPALLNEDERALWRSVYAVAFVNELDRLEAESTPYTVGARYVSRRELAARAMHAERPVMVADLAVHRLRQLRAGGSPREMNVGKRLAKLPESWEHDAI